MQQGTMLRCMVVFLSVLLATTTSVYANHFAAAGVKSHITTETSPTSDTEVQFWFLGVSSPKLGFEPVIPTQFQSTVVHTSERISFRLFAVAKENASFEVIPSSEEGEAPQKGHIITVKGKLLSHIVVLSKRGVRFFTEPADFTAVGVDVTTPGEGTNDVAAPGEDQARDSFNLEFVYSKKGSGRPLLEALAESGLLDCDDAKDTCTLRLPGKVEFGEITAHTAGGD